MKPYCKRCIWHLPKVEGLKVGGAADTDVCGETLQVEYDEVGNPRFRLRGDVTRCDQCGHMENDGRVVIYEKCFRRNKNLKCSHFKPHWYLRIFFIFKRNAP